MNSKKIVTLARTVAGIGEVLHWTGAASMAALAVLALTAPQWVNGLVALGAEGSVAELSVYGFELVAPITGGSVDGRVLLLFGLAAAVILSLTAMTLRDLRLIMKRSQDSTPFQADNIRMLREIGIFSVSVPLVGLAMSIVCRLVLGVDAVETSVNLYGFTMGLVVLCLTRVFLRGAALEREVDGLL